MMKRIFYSICVLSLIWTNYGCSGKKAENTQPVDSGLIEITSEQFKGGNMKVGTSGPQTFRTKVVCKGMVVAPANAMSKICPTVSGKVNTLKYKIGDFVNAGQVIATISGNDFMDLQQSFAEAAATYTKAKADYERAQSLWAEKIGAEKDFLAAKSYYRSTQASYQSLRSRIAALGVNPSAIEKGKMYSSFPVVAPISGYITKINAVIGQYADVQNEIVEIVNINRLQLQLSVYESDAKQLRVGQTVYFGTAGGNNNTLKAKLATIGKTVNSESKTIDCIATVDKSFGANLVNESYVEAVIVLNESKRNALPTSAVQKQGNEHFVFIVEKKEGSNLYLKKTKVNVGETEEGFIEITNQLPNKEIILQGIETL